MTIKIALIQYDVIYGKPEENFSNMRSLIEKAAAKNPDVVVLPEMWTTGYDLSRLEDIGDQDAGETKLFISELAEKHSVNIVAGSVGKKSDDGITNTMLVFDRAGQLQTEYSKVHLFRLMDEEKWLTAGETDGHFKLEDVACAGFICYDIRFPEWLRLHAAQGAKVLFVPAEWPKPRVDHWRNLLVSRAIENQCYVVACNRVGSDPNNEFGGHSMIVDPWGEIVAEADEDETIVFGTIEPEKVDEIRKKIPVFEDRRPGLYDRLS